MTSREAARSVAIVGPPRDPDSIGGRVLDKKPFTLFFLSLTR